MITYDLPAHWASYLFNGDSSSFSLYDDGEAEIKIIEELIHDIGCGDPVDVTDENEEFRKYHHARQYGIKACNCLTYTFYASN